MIYALLVSVVVGIVFSGPADYLRARRVTPRDPRDPPLQRAPGRSWEVACVACVMTLCAVVWCLLTIHGKHVHIVRCGTAYAGAAESGAAVCALIYIVIGTVSVVSMPSNDPMPIAMIVPFFVALMGAHLGSCPTARVAFSSWVCATLSCVGMLGICAQERTYAHTRMFRRYRYA